MTSSKERDHHDSWIARGAKGALPLLVCLALLVSARDSSPQSLIAVSVACATLLWFGWISIRRNILTKTIGVVLALYFGLIVALLTLAITIRLSLVLLPVFLLALPYLVYDLFFRAPSEGRHDAREH